MITSRTTSTLVLLCLISVQCLSGPANTLAQQAPAGVILRSLEREDRPPDPQSPPEKPVIEQEEQKRREAQAASAEKIPVRSFRIEGVTLLSADEVRAIVAPWESKGLSLAEIKAVAEGITAAYARQGYITAFAFVPAQEVRDGIVQIRAVEGRAGAITAEGNRSYSTPFVEGHLAAVREDPSIRLQTLERALLTLNSYPEMDAKAFLKAGKDPGTTDIIVRVSDRRPVNAGIAYDNFGQDYISRSRASVTLDAGNLAASGDMLSFRGLMGLDRLDPRDLFYGRAEYQLPAGHDGTRVGLSVADMQYRARKELEALDIEGRADTLSAFISRPLILRRDESLSLRFTYSYRDVSEHQLGMLRSEERIQALGLDARYLFLDRFQGNTLVAPGYHFGWGDRSGEILQDERDGARAKTDEHFHKILLDAARTQGLAGRSLLFLFGSGQYSPESLFSAEKFVIGGQGSVRGYQPAIRSGDSGYFVNTELILSPVPAGTVILKHDAGEALKLALFFDHGGIFRNRLVAGEGRSDYLTGLGAGLRVFATRHAQVRAEYAVPRINGRFDSSFGIAYLQVILNF